MPRRGLWEIELQIADAAAGNLLRELRGIGVASLGGPTRTTETLRDPGAPSASYLAALGAAWNWAVSMVLSEPSCMSTQPEVDSTAFS